MDKQDSQIRSGNNGADRRRGGRRPLMSPARFLELTSDEVARALRYDRPLSVVLISIDKLAKQLASGDAHAAIARFDQVSAIVIDALRSHDRSGRLSKGEIGILMPETTLKHVRPVAERLRDQIVDGLSAGALGDVHPTVSVGAAAVSPRMRNPYTFLMSAIFELRRAKSLGGSHVAVAEPDLAAVSIPRSSHIH